MAFKHAPFLLLALAAAGCAGTPGGTAPPAAEDYSFDLRIGTDRTAVEDHLGKELADVTIGKFTATWYPLGVKDDEYPYALQPYMQRAHYVRAGLGFGGAEFPVAAPGEDGDPVFGELSGAYFHADSGLAFRGSASFGSMKMETTDDFNLGEWNAALVIQTEKGFSAELGYKVAHRGIYYDELFTNGGDDIDYKAVRVGTSQVFSFAGSQALQYAVFYEFGQYDLRDTPYDVKAGISRTETHITYYPVKCFGFGIEIDPVFFDGDLGTVSARHRFEVAIHMKLTLKQRLDMTLDFRGYSNDLNLDNEPHSYSNVSFNVGYRF